MSNTFDYAIECKSRARFGWIMDQLQAAIIFSEGEGADGYTTTDSNTIEVSDRRINVIRFDESIELRGDIETSKIVMRRDGYVYLELYRDNTNCGTIRIQGTTDINDDKAEIEADRLYRMFTVMGTPWMA